MVWPIYWCDGKLIARTAKCIQSLVVLTVFGLTVNKTLGFSLNNVPLFFSDYRYVHYHHAGFGIPDTTRFVYVCDDQIKPQENQCTAQEDVFQ